MAEAYIPYCLSPPEQDRGAGCHLDVVVDAESSECDQVDERQNDIDDEDRPPVPPAQEPAQTHMSRKMTCRRPTPAAKLHHYCASVTVTHSQV